MDICGTPPSFCGSSDSTGARRYPLSYIFTGYYTWGSGTSGLYNQGSYGLMSTSTPYSTSNVYVIAYMGSLDSQYNSGKIGGFSLRYNGEKKYTL